eukprot:6490615-Amphidinium_carterae.2
MEAAAEEVSIEKLLVAKCNHPKTWQSYTDLAGKTQKVFARHPPLTGRKTANGKWATAASAVYPASLNLSLAKAMASSPAVKNGSNPVVLSLFGGNHDRPNGLAQYLQEFMVDTITVDIVNQPKEENDLYDDRLWQKLLDQTIAGKFSFILAAPMCTTWSAARQNDGRGPRPLRSETELYGIKNPQPPLTPSEKEQVRIGTLFVLKTFLVCEAAAKVGAGFCIENPAPKAGHPSIYKLPEFKRLEETWPVKKLITHQCCFGAETSKPTCLAWYGGRPLEQAQ